MKQSDIEAGLLEIFSAVLGHSVKSDVKRAEEPGWDSLKHMQIIFAVEEKFGVQFTEAEIPQLDSINSFVSHLERHAA
jgi:acyl carrier protein